MKKPQIERKTKINLPESLSGQLETALALLPDGSTAQVERITSGYDVANHILLIRTSSNCYIFRARQEQALDCLESYVGLIFERAGFLSMGGNIRLRTISEEVDFMRHALAVGLPVPQIICANSDWMIIEYFEGLPLYQLVESGEYRHLLNMLQELYLAHQKGIIYGDRWGGNEIVDSDGMIHMIDFEIEWVYNGSQPNVLKNLEFSWFLFNILRMSNQRDGILNLIELDAVTMLEAWGYELKTIKKFIMGFAEFYLSPDKPIYPSSSLSFPPDPTFCEPINHFLTLLS